MKIKKILLFLSLLLLLFSCKENTVKNEPEAVHYTNIYEANALLNKSINLGNALEAPAEGEWGVTIKDDYFKLIRDKGFTGVRIPIRWSAHTQENPPYSILPAFKNRVDHVIDEALKNDLAVVINIHHFEEIMERPAENKAKLLSLWEQISDYYKDYSDKLYFEILNEPHSNLTAEIWNDYLAECLTIIRENNPDRPVIIGTANWGGISAMQKLEIPQDEENLILTIHYYEPFHFTHQGAEWVDNSEEWLGTKWLGTAEEKAKVTDHFSRIKQFADARNMPVYVGEFGAYSTADQASRATWTGFIVETCRDYNFSYAYWEFCSGFGIYDDETGEWNNYLLNALIDEEE